MQEILAILKKYKLPILAVLLTILTAVGLWQGILLLQDNKEHKARRTTFAAALAEIDPKNTAVSFRVPYESSLFTPENIGLGQLDDTAKAALDLLLTSMVYDKEATESSCFVTENVQVATAVPQGRMTLSMGSDDFCIAQITTDGQHWETAVYTYDTAARDALLACGGLPTISEMKEAIESNLQDSINNLGDLADRPDKPK